MAAAQDGKLDPVIKKGRRVSGSQRVRGVELWAKRWESIVFVNRQISI